MPVGRASGDVEIGWSFPVVLSAPTRLVLSADGSSVGVVARFLRCIAILAIQLRPTSKPLCYRWMDLHLMSAGLTLVVHRSARMSAHFVGLAMLLISIVSLDSRSIPPFPNAYTLLPTCGTAMILFCGRRETWVGWCLSLKTS